MPVPHMLSADVHTTARARPAHNDGLSLAIAHHAGLSQMTGTRNDFSATRPWVHHLGTLKSVGNATSRLISTSCPCHMSTGHTCAFPQSCCRT